MASVTLTSAGPAVHQKGERGTLAFDELYQTHVQTVARWAARLGGPGVDVQDITQEVFVVVNRCLPAFRHESQVSTWLFSITAKVVANDRRRRKLRAWWLPLVPNIADRTPAETDNPIEHLEKRERHAQFYRALDGLNERQRRALVLFELEDLHIAEIAELMKLRPGNVRVLLHRARAAFLKRLTACELREATAVQNRRELAGQAGQPGQPGRKGRR